MAALSRATHEGGPGPLEGLNPDVLQRGVKVALDAGLVDDLDWLAPQAAGVALYTLAAALPVGGEQRELGRRVLARLLAADAETFTAIATRMAQTGGKGLSSPAIRARVALVTELPIASGIADGPLALALVNRREYAREWIATPSTRSLPARRLAAKIIERASREAARRAQLGDPQAFRFLATEAVRSAYDRLLADRESLVWRYVAVARGLAAAWVPELLIEVHEGLKEGLSPTEWRRATTSLAAFGAVRPDEALRLTQGLVKRGFFGWEDPASAGTFVWGIARTIEAEPETASKMLDAVVGVAAPDVFAEAVAELRYEYGISKVVERTAKKALEATKSDRAKAKERGEDDGADALLREVARDLEMLGSSDVTRDDLPLRSQVADAVEAFVHEGAPGAYAKAREVLSAARGGMDALEAVARDDHEEGRTGSLARRTSMAALRDVDAALLERNVVSDLLKLGGSSDQVRSSEDALDALRERLAEWIVTCEGPTSIAAGGGASLRHATLRLRRLRALLHLLDGDLGDAPEVMGARSSRTGNSDLEGETLRAKRLQRLWLRTVRSLLEHFDHQPLPMLKRTLLAALARALDALVRLGVCDVADALLVFAQRIKSTGDFETLAEASMDPDLCHVLSRYARFLRETDGTKPVEKKPTDRVDSLFPPSVAPPSMELRTARLKAFYELATELAPEASPRSEALRTVLVRLHSALDAIARANSLAGLATSDASEADAVGAVETWASAIIQMCVGARARLDPESSPASIAQPRLLSQVVSRVLTGTDPCLTEETLGPAIDDLVQGLPFGMGRLVAGILWQLGELPVERPSRVDSPMTMGGDLPAWLPARRTLGGFYVVRALGFGGTASVFVVNRMEDRNESNAERFALKVPDYNATAARSVSQDEFLKLFREEASALIMLPNHVNLARFVTFDLAARPLPILVMELVEGVALERVIALRSFDMKRCLKALDDVLAGLEAMHSVGLGHLDLKPSNVLLRRGEQAVLVDFGLSGRKIRPGCGTGPYGAPEVWGVVPDDVTPTVMAADIYSFGCLAFEMITGQMLFEAPNEVTQISMHVSHDGMPAPLRSLVLNPDVGPLAEILIGALRRDPTNRPSAEKLRRDIRSVVSMVQDAPWPTVPDGAMGH